MTVFEDLNSMNIDQFAQWFEEYCLHDDDPCIRWFDKTYCQNCEAVDKDGMEYAYCELNGKCRYFKDMNEMPNIRQTIKLWLESEHNSKDECVNTANTCVMCDEIMPEGLYVCPNCEYEYGV